MINQLFEIGVIQFGQFTLKSGQVTPIYINLRKIISYPNILRAIAEMLWSEAKNSQFDFICGVPYTALPIATTISILHDLPMVMRRREKKDYGTKQSIEGDFKAGQSCLLIEDVITSGASILETIKDIENAGLQVLKVLAFIDREQAHHPNLSNYPVKTIFNLPEILTYLADSGRLSSEELDTIQQFTGK